MGGIGVRKRDGAGEEGGKEERKERRERDKVQENERERDREGGKEKETQGGRAGGCREGEGGREGAGGSHGHRVTCATLLSLGPRGIGGGRQVRTLSPRTGCLTGKEIKIKTLAGKRCCARTFPKAQEKTADISDPRYMGSDLTSRSLNGFSRFIYGV